MMGGDGSTPSRREDGAELIFILSRFSIFVISRSLQIHIFLRETTHSSHKFIFESKQIL